MDEFTSQPQEDNERSQERVYGVSGFSPEIKEDSVGGEMHHAVNPRIVFGAILFFGIFTLLFGGYKIWSDIRAPSLAQQQARQSLETVANVNSALVAPTEAELRAADTDGDGLNDWAELNQYGTSPYLKDSDGDGYSDTTEIESNNDPNCPRGQNCSVAATPAQGPTPASAFSELLPSDSTGSEIVAPPDYANLTAPQLRELMLQTGQVTQEQLDQIDDATLMQMYQETLAQQEEQQAQQTSQ